MTDPIGQIVVTYPVMLSCFTAPASYGFSRYYNIPLYKVGLWYSGGTLSTALLLNIVVWMYGKSVMKKDPTAGGGVGIMIIGMGLGSGGFMISHLSSYWGLLFGIKHRGAIWDATKSTPVSFWKGFKDMFK